MDKQKRWQINLFDFFLANHRYEQWPADQSIYEPSIVDFHGPIDNESCHRDVLFEYHRAVRPVRSLSDFSRLLTGMPILAVFQNLRWNSSKTSLLK